MGYGRYSSYTIDESTGLPELPSNLFWRIRNDNVGNRENPRIVIVERFEYESGFWKWKKTKVRTEETQFYSWVFNGLNRSNILYAAETVMDKYSTHLINAENKNYLGDYPPNSIN